MMNKSNINNHHEIIKTCKKDNKLNDTDSCKGFKACYSSKHNNSHKDETDNTISKNSNLFDYKDIFHIVTKEECIRVDMFLAEKYKNLTRSYIKKMIDEGKILVNDEIKKSGYKLKSNDDIKVFDIEIKQLTIQGENIPIDIIYEDENCLVINKPQNMVVYPSINHFSGTLLNALIGSGRQLSTINGVGRAGIVHRIDKDTSGLLIIAKNDSAHQNLSKQIANKVCSRKYYALVDGVVDNDDGVIITNIDRDNRNRLKKAVCKSDVGRFAETHYKVLKRYDKYTLLMFELKTGRTHQIRVHAEYIKHPIVGDKLYNKNKCEFKLEGQLLHAKILEFNRVSDNYRISVECELPDYFKKILDSLNEI